MSKVTSIKKPGVDNFEEFTENKEKQVEETKPTEQKIKQIFNEDISKQYLFSDSLSNFLTNNTSYIEEVVSF